MKKPGDKQIFVCSFQSRVFEAAKSTPEKTNSCKTFPFLLHSHFEITLCPQRILAQTLRKPQTPCKNCCEN